MNRYKANPATDRPSRTPARAPGRRRASRIGLERLEDRSLLALLFGNALGVGGNGATGVETASVALDAAGSRYITGSFSGTVDFGGNGAASAKTSNGLRDGFVAKYDASGALQTFRTFGGALNDRAAAVALDANGDMFVTGYYQGIVKFDTGQTLNSGATPAAFVWEIAPNGNTTFLNPIATSGSIQPQSIAVNPAGTAFAVGGFFTGTMTVGATALTSTGDVDAFVAKGTFGATGLAYPWASQLAALAGSQALVNSLAIDPSGNVAATGQFQGTVDFDPGAATNLVTSNGNGVDAFVERFNSTTGLRDYVLAVGGAGQDVGSGVAADAAGNVLAVGSFQQTINLNVNGTNVALTTPAGTSGYDLIKIAPNGTVTVGRALNALTTGTNTGTPSVAVNAAGTVAVALTYTAASGASGLPAPPLPTRGGSSDILIETLDGQGNVLQQAAGGGTSDDQANSVAVNNAGQIAAAGSYQGPASLGAFTLPNKFTAATGTNIFVASMRSSVVPGDFLGNGTTQPAVFRTSTAQWFVQGRALSPFFGTGGVDLPVPGDYEGSGRTQEAVYKPGDATWYYRASDGTVKSLGQFGWAGHDIPVPGDYDGIGRTELAVYRPSTAQWFVQSPGGARQLPTFGWAGHDIPVPADYLGTGVTQQAVYRPSTGQWFVAGTSGVYATFGWAGHDIPVPGDYARVGRAVPAVYRPESGQWYVSGTPGVFTTFGWPTPFGQRPLNDFPALARTGTLNGLPGFGAGGTISGVLPPPQGGNHGLSPASAPRSNINVAITPAASLPAPSFVKAQSKRPSQGLASRARG